MRFKRKPGVLLEVDWTGQTKKVKDQATGEEMSVYVFVSAFPCSQMLM
ncbi:hypothetical protein [Alkalihalobacillus deserti]|nr:hypothetical protein [Alkalihalobacillus deserti]